MSRSGAAIAAAVILFTSCQKETAVPDPIDPVVGKYEDGFFLIHEGWFGRGSGEASFFRYSTEQLSDSVFLKENKGKEAGTASSTLQYAAKLNDKIYLVNKAGGPVIAVDAKTFKETGRMSGTGNDFRAIAGLDDQTALLSSSNGIFLLDLRSMKANTKLAAASGQVGDLLNAGTHIFALSQSEGAVIYKRSDLSVAKKIKGVTQGFAQTPDKQVWYTKGKFLYNIDPGTLVADSVELPWTTSSTWFAWYPSPIIASTRENTVYLVRSASFGGGKELYRYVSGKKESLALPFIIMPDKQSFYKKNLGFDGKRNELVTTSVQDGFGSNYTVNTLYFHDAQTGALKKRMPFNKVMNGTIDESYYFTSMFLFPD
ncbi:DUF5074 domain-containing protein [Pedobacter sp. SYP-B3415]|uniref:DUF5074 domain-containing protein n=1 Tax=Pedobacter sp. SYP-B3415 TaxID=2496641 RepID=UPI0013EB98CF|nr:DUF5074 domain-containing protein [Pedobacter sp. SYP-B3415]